MEIQYSHLFRIGSEEIVKNIYTFGIELRIFFYNLY